MRSLRDYSIGEWFKLEPVSDTYKQIRNDLMLQSYLRKDAVGQAEFLAACQSLRGQDIAVVVAFEQPWALEWLLIMSRRHLMDCTVLVFDNSRREEARAEIAEVCRRQGVAYLPLPANRTRHVNRSHGMAMTWIYQNIIRAIEPEGFAYLDHDLIPMQAVSIRERLGKQDCFGPINESAWGWQLWAGYSLFRFARTRTVAMNFLYDFSFGLDTGGRNWKLLYRFIDRATQCFADNKFINISNLSGAERRTVQVIDESWLHIGSISYNNNFDEKREFFENLAKNVEAGASWAQITATEQ
jgi:hypothetical protein